MTLTPKELAQKLDVNETLVRKILRAKYRPNRAERGPRWYLDDEMQTYVTREVTSRR